MMHLFYSKISKKSRPCNLSCFLPRSKVDHGGGLEAVPREDPSGPHRPTLTYILVIMTFTGEEFTPKAVLVTGGAGFIASHVAIKLVQRFPQTKVRPHYDPW